MVTVEGLGNAQIGFNAVQGRSPFVLCFHCAATTVMQAKLDNAVVCNTDQDDNPGSVSVFHSDMQRHVQSVLLASMAHNVVFVLLEWWWLVTLPSPLPIARVKAAQQHRWRRPLMAISADAPDTGLFLTLAR